MFILYVVNNHIHAGISRCCGTWTFNGHMLNVEDCAYIQICITYIQHPNTGWVVLICWPEHANTHYVLIVS